MARKSIIVSSIVALFMLASASITAIANNSKARVARADELSTLQTNFKLDWNGRTDISADGNYYKSFTGTNDAVLSDRVEGTPIYMYDGTYSTYENPSPKYQVTPYSGYKTVQIRNYNNNNTTFYMYLNYGRTYTGAETDYGNFFELTPLGSKNTVIKSLKIGTRDSSAKENLWYRTSSNGVDWVGTLTDAYKLVFTSGTKSFDLSIPTGAKYLRVYQCNNGSQDLRTSATLTDISIDYEEEGAIRVTFDPQNGSSTSSQSVNDGDHLVEPPVPVKAPVNGHRYEFLGWFTESVGGTQWDFENDTVSAEGTLYAHWNDIAVDEYTVSYVSNGDSAVASETVGVGEYFSEPATPIKTSDDPRYVYTFDAWCTNAELTVTYDFGELPTEDVTLYGRYTKSIASAPAGTTTYNVKNFTSTDEPYASAVPSYTDYESRVMDSKETFDYGNDTRQQIFLDVQGAADGCGIKKGKGGGEGTSAYDLVVKNATMNITWADKTKVLSFVRVQFHRVNYQSYASFDITLKVTGSNQVLSTCLAPGGTNHVDEDCVQASFTAAQDVRSVTISMLDSHIYVDLRYIVLGFADEIVDTAATNFATRFNDAEVCGTLDSDGLNGTKWTTQEAEYNKLSDQVKAYLTNYDGDNAEVLECLERYDRVVYLHGESYDFMGRVAAGKVTPKTSTFNVQGINNGGNDSSMAIILVSVASVALIGLFFFVKRKKEI